MKTYDEDWIVKNAGCGELFVKAEVAQELYGTLKKIREVLACQNGAKALRIVESALERLSKGEHK